MLGMLKFQVFPPQIKYDNHRKITGNRSDVRDTEQKRQGRHGTKGTGQGQDEWGRTGTGRMGQDRHRTNGAGQAQDGRGRTSTGQKGVRHGAEQERVGRGGTGTGRKRQDRPV